MCTSAQPSHNLPGRMQQPRWCTLWSPPCWTPSSTAWGTKTSKGPCGGSLAAQTHLRTWQPIWAYTRKCSKTKSGDLKVLPLSWHHFIAYCLHASPYFLPEYYFSVAYSPANAGDTRDTGSIHESRRSLEEEMATHSSILAWEILWTEDPCGLQSTGLQRVKQDWACTHTHVLTWQWRVLRSFLYQNHSLTESHYIYGDSIFLSSVAQASSKE